MEWVKKGLARNGKAGEVEDGSAGERARLEAPTDGDGNTCQGALETPQERRERWRSVYIIYFTMFQMSLGFSIVLTGVWPYLDKLEPGASKEVLGLAVGAAPLGQLLCSPALGLWANRRGPRAPLLASLALFVLSSAGYASLHAARPHAAKAMLVTRFLVGVSSASVAVARAYLSAATLVGERTRAVAAVSLAQVLGFVVGPALQAAAAPLGPGAPYTDSQPRLDMYTAPGWLNAALGALNLALLLPCCFKEHRIATKEAMRAHGKGSEAEALKLMRPDPVSAWTLVGAFFVLNFSFVLLETLATPLTMDQFGWGKAPALRYMGALMSAGAVVACLTFALISPLTRVFQERAVLLWGGFLLVGLASVLCIPWGPGGPPLAPPGGRRLPGRPPALVPHLTRPLRHAVLPGLRGHVGRLPARGYAHTDYILQGARPEATGRVDGRADGRGLRGARAGPGVRGAAVRAARARRRLRGHRRADPRHAARAARALPAPAAPRAPRARPTPPRPPRAATSPRQAEHVTPTTLY